MFDSVEQFEEFTKEQIELADAIVKMTQTDGWKHIQDLIDENKKRLNQPAEIYYQNKGLAGYHAGGMYVIKMIEIFIEQQLKIINDPKYVQDNNKGEGK